MTTPTEHAEQAAFFQAIAIMANQDSRLKAVFAIPNAGKRSVGAAVYYQQEGLRAGVPDIFVPIANTKKHGLFIEMKRKGAKLKENQLVWIRLLEGLGYQTAVCYSCDDALSALRVYLTA